MASSYSLVALKEVVECVQAMPPSVGPFRELAVFTDRQYLGMRCGERGGFTAVATLRSLRNFLRGRLAGFFNSGLRSQSRRYAALDIPLIAGDLGDVPPACRVLLLDHGAL